MFNKNAPPPLELSPEEIDSHILGVLLANCYTPKKSKELFGDHANEAIMTELSEIDRLEIYGPQRINDLTYKDKNKRLNN